MLIIRKEQMEAFEETALRNFEDEMVEHIKEFDPKRSESIGEGGVREAVRMGIERAEACGLTNQGPVRLFIEMMFLFGSFFDTDPQYSWAGEILIDTEGTDQMERANQLYIKTTDYLDRVACSEHMQRALGRIENISFKENLKLSEKNQDSFIDEMAKFLHRIYPEKYQYSGEPAIKEMIQNAINSAEDHLPSDNWGSAIFSVMMFFLGHECLIDPQFPWIRETLDNDDLDEQQIASLLYSKMKVHLRKVILQ